MCGSGVEIIIDSYFSFIDTEGVVVIMLLLSGYVWGPWYKGLTIGHQPSVSGGISKSGLNRVINGIMQFI